MSIDKKKLAAMNAAVFMYIKTQEEAAFYAAQTAGGPAGPEAAQLAAPAQVVQANAWGMAGRSAHMQARTLMQMRAFK